MQLKGLAEVGPEDVTMVFVPAGAIPRPCPNGGGMEGTTGATVKLGVATLLLDKWGKGGGFLPG